MFLLVLAVFLLQIEINTVQVSLYSSKYNPDIN